MKSTVAGRLRQVAGRQTLRLTHYGRRSGKPYEVTIWFVADGDKIYLPTGNVNRQWVRNVKKTPRVRLSIGGESFDGEARFLTEPGELGGTMAMVRRKYWMFLPFIAVWRILSVLGLAQYETGAFQVRLSVP
jgi:deazaflavin-dependent oxidoreductase (nitroreductase family)